MNAPLRHSFDRDAIPLAWRERPFDGFVNRAIIVRDGGRWPTVAEIVSRTENLPADFDQRGEVRINGELVPRGCWHLVRPKLTMRCAVGITLHMPLRDGGGGEGGGQKNILALVATIAVLLVAAAISGGALVALGAPIGLFGAGQIGATLAAAAVTIGGSLAIAALTPPPTLPDTTTATDASVPDISGKPVSLSGNVLAPGASVSRVVGTHRVFPPLLCEPLIELVGDVEYGEVVFGLAGAHAIPLSGVRVGNVPVSEIPEIVSEIQEGKQDSPIQSLVPRQGKTQQLNIELSRHQMNKSTGFQVRILDQAVPANSLPVWHRVVSRNAPDEIWLTLAFPEGLFSELNATTACNMPVRVRFRLRGDLTWIDCPEVHFSFNKPSPFQKTIRLKWGTIPTAISAPPTSQGPIYAFKRAPAQTVTPAGAEWNAHSSFTAGAGNDLLSAATVATSNVRNVELYQDKAIFYLSEGTFPKGVYEVEVKAGQAYFETSFAPTTYNYGGLGVFDFYGYRDVGSGLLQTILDQADLHNRAVITRVASVWNENPIRNPDDFATISIKVHSRSLDQLSCLASGYVYDHDGSGWNTLTTTSSPAAHFRDVLIGRNASDPMPADMLDDAGIVAWRTHCAAMGYTVNLVVDGKSSKDVATVIAACGKARPRMSESWGVVVDKDRSAETPVQIFSPRNMRSFSFDRAFSVEPTHKRVRFDDATDDYREATITVANPFVAPDTPIRFEETRYDGLVTEATAEAQALFDFENAYRRLVFFTGEAPAEAIVAQRGDLVGVQHDVMDARAGFSRVKSVVTSGANVTGLVFDGSIPMPTEDAFTDIASAFSSYGDAFAAVRTGVAIRLNDQTSIIKEATAADTESKTITFVTPFANPGSSVLAPDCHVVSGALGSEYARMLVFDVAPKADLTAMLTFVPEAPELWS